MSPARFLLATILLITLWGCSTDKATREQPSDQQATQPTPQAPPAHQAEPAPSPAAPSRGTARPAEKRQAARSASAADPHREPEVERSTPVANPGRETNTSISTGAQNSAPPSVRTAPAPVLPKPAVISSGTRMNIRLVDGVSSEDNNSGDEFKASLDQDPKWTEGSWLRGDPWWSESWCTLSGRAASKGAPRYR